MMLDQQNKEAYRPSAKDRDEKVSMGINQSQYALMNDSQYTIRLPPGYAESMGSLAEYNDGSSANRKQGVTVLKES